MTSTNAAVHARRTDPITSHLAAATVRELPARRLAVWQALNTFGDDGATDGQLADLYGHYTSNVWADHYPKQFPSGLRTRRNELVADGLVEDTGRKTQMRTGRLAIVWRTCSG